MPKFQYVGVSPKGLHIWGSSDSTTTIKVDGVDAIVPVRATIKLYSMIPPTVGTTIEVPKSQMDAFVKDGVKSTMFFWHIAD